ncbi:unnamed protein product, partial [Rotaria sp. Silwood1]
MLGVYVLTIYSATTITSRQITIKNPNVSQFEELYKLYSPILSCPCRRLSMPRSTFMHNQVQFHPFCASSFVRNDLWFQYWTMKFPNGTFDPTPSYHWADFRKNGLKFFNYVRIFCDLAITTVSDALSAFEAEQFFSSQPITKLEFDELTNFSNTLVQSQ